MSDLLVSATGEIILSFDPDDELKPCLSSPVWSWAQRIIALLLCIILSPLFLLLFLAVCGTSRGRFIFKQERPGLLGKPFNIYKIRTMTMGSEKQTPLGVQRTDPAITALGKLLRDTKLDELPQLWNIVQGDMEFVGPRPIPLALHNELKRFIYQFDMRYAVKPGLTNLAQLCILDNKIGEQMMDDWHRRFQAEFQQIKHKNAAYDIMIIFMTVMYMSRKTWFAITGRDFVKRRIGTIQATQILGVPICNLDYEGVMSQIAKWIHEGSNRYIGVCPVHSIIDSLFNREHRRALLCADLNTADGMPVVWMQKLLGYQQASRVYGPTLMLKTLERAQQEGWRIAFYGGQPDRLPLLLDNLKEQFPKLKIVEAISPPLGELSQQQQREHIDQLNKANPYIVWVGLGSPKQEIWMARYSRQINAVVIGVGAAFDFHAGVVKQAPEYLQNIGMEWAFRLYCEPRRLFKRYLRANPLFIALALRQLARHWLLRENYQCRCALSLAQRKIREATRASVMIQLNAHETQPVLSLAMV